MKIVLINTGKTTENHIKEGLDVYFKRLSHYFPLEIIDIPEVKTKQPGAEKQKEMEGELLLKYIPKYDYVIVLDEKGMEYSSEEFAGHLQKLMNRGIKSLAFITGGAYGFSKEVYAKAHERISLSRMTFPHQLVRLIFIEQLYRAATILNNEPYHHI
ncbi:MAG: 23S rRNA (pseudouridine(1915)-N(3))-methyltransferase RlmH [Bacteroidales bacterium]|nr:23S rRNA (pseudouridine(1915)-N(3))-methyltransferase RlmH [Bacteroidales bacterium]